MVEQNRICEECETEIGRGFTKTKEYEEIKGLCESCGIQIEEYFTPSEWKRASSKEKLILSQISEVKNRSGPTICVILGIIGLFVFVAPGIILFIIAGIWSHSKTNKIRELELELHQTESKKRPVKKDHKKGDPLTILKRAFAKGKISEKEYHKKRGILRK